MKWLKDEWPDWRDDGKRVEVEPDDGTTVAGKLEIDDFLVDGDGEEIPIFMVIADDEGGIVLRVTNGGGLWGELRIRGDFCFWLYTKDSRSGRVENFGRVGFDHLDQNLRLSF